MEGLKLVRTLTSVGWIKVLGDFCPGIKEEKKILTQSRSPDRRRRGQEEHRENKKQPESNKQKPLAMNDML